MNLKNNPVAYWAFQTNLPKEDVRDITQSIACETLRMGDPYAPTPWRIDLFRIEEFEKGLSLPEQYEKLIPLRGWEGRDDESYLLSTTNMLQSYFVAQKFLREESSLEEMIEKSKEKELNYLVRANHDRPIPSCAYNGSIAVMNFLSDISLELFDTAIKDNSNDFRNQFFGYFENSKNSDFIISTPTGEIINP